MSPKHFEATYQAMWDTFAAQIAEAKLGKRTDGAQLATHYRRVCEHLALAQSRAYPIHLVSRLESLTQDAHQLIYRRQDYGMRQLAQLLRVGLPNAVRAERRVVLLALLLFALPLVLSLALSWHSPDFALRLLNASQLRNYEAMYADGQDALGRLRGADGDWQMFGHYIFNNIGIGFRAFGAGILAGVGSAFVLIYNGLLIGVVAGHLQRVGLGHNFWPFVATHSAFELTGIVLSGAAGLRIGLGWIVPGRLSRGEALRASARAAIPLVYAAFFLLLVAAGFEAFWSSAAWIAPAVKYGVAAGCWALVLAWLCLMGRGSVHAR
ncbi:stage II sporulation protein M [Roseateles amylovorans]|uniref:Stage II sporulation protein M n=1 Tax=Roseateles amylovorans TaxID=2978473 RepID=A0ABY6B2N1_9BURK|nr:stage II sporulation protein M [Roseateles amylovorans]UXH79648.1 stage II sporulation protein M [Roseateles amylovorans]